LKRRDLLRSVTLAGTAGLLGLQPHAVCAEPPPETTRLRIKRDAGLLCEAPAQVAEELLRVEGFSEVQYVWTFGADGILEKTVAGEIDLALITALPAIRWIEAGEPLVILAGIHVGCFELIAREPVRTIRDLKGKVVAVSYLGGTAHLLTAIMAALSA
jgi:NitT/TauT family transport system substrate-binding protein